MRANPSLTTTRQYLLSAIVLIQIIHTLLWLFRLFDFPEPKNWMELLCGIPYGSAWQVLALAVELKLLYDLPRQKRWAWAFTLILAVHSSFHMVFSWYFQSMLLKTLTGILIAALPVCYIVLWRTRKAFTAGRGDFTVIWISILVATTIIVIERYSFDHGVIDYTNSVPPWSDFFLLSLLNQPSQFSLLVFWCCYGIVAATAEAFRRRVRVGPTQLN